MQLFVVIQKINPNKNNNLYITFLWNIVNMTYTVNNLNKEILIKHQLNRSLE